MMQIMPKLSLIIPILLLYLYCYIYTIHVCFRLSLFMEECDDSLSVCCLCLYLVMILNVVFVEAVG